MPRPKPGKEKQKPRPQISINWKEVDGYLEAGSSGTEIADMLGIHSETLYIRTVQEKGMGFSAYSSRKKSRGDAEIRRKQHEEALGIGTGKANIKLLLYLGEIRLGQKKDVETDTSNIRSTIVAEQEIRRCVAAALQARGIVELGGEDQQPPLDQERNL